MRKYLSLTQNSMGDNDKPPESEPNFESDKVEGE